MTILVGTDQTVNPGTPGNYDPQIYFQPFVAVATGTAATMSVRLFTTAGSVILGIADASRNVLGQTAQFTATTGLNTQNLTAGVTINSGTTYNLFVAFATEAFPAIATDGTTATILEPYGANGGFTWPTIPSPFPAAVNSDALGTMGIYASSASGTSYTLTAAQGAYSLTGYAATLGKGYNLVAATGLFGLTGESAVRDLALGANQGTFALTGYAVTAPGSAAISEPPDAVVASGMLSISGSAALTEAQDATVATGSLSLTGSASLLESLDIVSAAAASGAALSGDITEGADTVAASGGLSVAGSAAITERPDTASVQGSLVLTGSAAAIESNDVVSDNAALLLSASAAILEFPDIVVASQQAIISASVAVSESADVAQAIAYFGTPIQAGRIPLVIVRNNTSLQVIQ